MIQESHRAKVDWILPVGANLPTIVRYITVARFPEDEGWPDEAWSIVVDFDTPPAEQGTPSFGRVRFLVHDAPYQRLCAGAHFSLYEGRAETARVEIIGEQ